MVTNSFKCTDTWALLGDVSAIHSLILSNLSHFDMEFYIDPLADLPSDDLSGHRLKANDKFFGYFPEAGFLFVRNFFRSLNKDAYGAVSLETFSWIDLTLPKITGFLTAGSTGFDFETDAGVDFFVTQLGVTTPYIGNGPTAVAITGLNDTDEVTVLLTHSSTYFKFKNNAWLSLKLQDIGNITTLANSFRALSSMTSFSITANLNQVTDFSFTWYFCAGLTSFDTSRLINGINFSNTWRSCTGLTSFDANGLIHGINFSNAWYGCTSLTSFDSSALIAGTDFSYSWYDCSGLTSFDTSGLINGANFEFTWRLCLLLICLSDSDFSNLTIGTDAFLDCNALIQPPPTGTPIRDGINATAGTWTNPGACP